MPRFSTVAEFLDPEEGHRPTEAERALIEACREGEPCILGDATRPDAPSDERTIRATLLRLLITGGTPGCGLADDGVSVVGAWIDGPLILRYAKAHGRTILDACHFIDKPNLSQARLHLLSLEGSHLPGLFAQGMVVKGSVFLRRLTATGTVVVTGAKIGGQLACTGAKLDGKDGRALNAQGVTVGQSLVLSGLTATGTVDVAGAEIGGQMSCIGATLDGKDGMALNADRLLVKAALYWRKVTVQNGGISFASAHAGDLVDDMGSWPKGEDQLLLDGFTYGRITAAPTDAKRRLDWLETGAVFDGTLYPQPYTQLARVLAQMGHHRSARKVLEQRARLLGIEARLAGYRRPDGSFLAPLEKPLRDVVFLLPWLFDRVSQAVVGYGFAPHRALYAIGALFLTAATLAHLAWTEGSFAPNSDVILTSPGWLQAEAADCIPTSFPGCDPNPASTWSDDPARGLDWDSFNRYGYAADLVIPILNLGQAEAWAPSRDRGYWGRKLWWGRWLLEALGWLVTALGVAAITGIMQRNAPE